MIHPETLSKFQAAVESVHTSEFRGETRAVVPKATLFDALKMLRDECGFDLLVDITCVDYLHYRDAVDRFGLVYLLASTVTNERLTLRVFLNEPDLNVPSAVPLWEGANWMEREVWDMFGIRFDGHPDLRRILLPEEFTAFPLRKDYPLQGRGERHNLPVLTRNRS
ncbi:MAG TPA: NADH-quinone oxidoreductase subunit C [Pirellulales bacterium]|nr:NADH-quinone oxidoreductase subunit C [Pirellulales bacterium]HVA48153.1 NADH-quinone oxidoreductase subunit C [Pirellulales bacterium]